MSPSRLAGIEVAVGSEVTASGGEFLERALQGHVSADFVGELLRQRVREDQYLDYKSGLWLEKLKGEQASKVGHPTDPAGKLRKWVAGFANAEGGALVIGVTDAGSSSPYVVDGCARASDRRDWITRVVGEFVAYLPSPVRIHAVEVDDKLVIVIAVPRAVRLLSCVEHGQQVHYLRIGEQTLTVPTYLLADLTLGRRERPFLSFEVAPAPRAIEHAASVAAYTLSVRNEGLSTLDRYVFGCVSYGIGDHELVGSVSRYVEVIPPIGDVSVRAARANLRYVQDPLPPFARAADEFKVLLPSVAAGSCVRVRAVALLAAEGDLPRLLQIDITAKDGLFVDQVIGRVAPGARGVISAEEV